MKIPFKNFFKKFTPRRSARDTANKSTEMEVYSMNDAAQAAVTESKRDSSGVSTTTFINNITPIEILDPAGDKGLLDRLDLFEGENFEEPQALSRLHIIRDNVEFEIDDLVNNFKPLNTTCMVMANIGDNNDNSDKICKEISQKTTTSDQQKPLTIITVSGDDGDDVEQINQEICQEVCEKTTSDLKSLEDINGLSSNDVEYLLRHVMKYENLRYLNEGVYGMVFEVCQPPSASTSKVACKVSRLNTDTEKLIKYRWTGFVKELKVLRELQLQGHQNICPSYGQFVLYCGAKDTSANYTVTAVTDESCTDVCHRQNGARVPLLSGLTLELFPMSLHDWMDSFSPDQLSGDMLCRVFTQIGAALVHIHTRLSICHNDLHRGNIAVYDTAGIVLKLIDFGISEKHTTDLYDEARHVALAHTLDNSLTVDTEYKFLNPFLVEARKFAIFLLQLSVSDLIMDEHRQHEWLEVFEEEAQLDEQNAQHCAFARVLSKTLFDSITFNSVTVEWMLEQYYDQLQ